MINKPLIAGIVGFMAGGLLVAIAATTFDKPQPTQPTSNEVTMSQMTEMLKPLSGDAYDKAFIQHMIDHHQAAVDMARLSATRAKHQEIKDLSLAIITAQEKEINDMVSWQHQWGYAPNESMDMSGGSHSM